MNKPACSPTFVTHGVATAYEREDMNGSLGKASLNASSVATLIYDDCNVSVTNIDVTDRELQFTLQQSLDHEVRVVI
jgi:hypothetical protein